jgi:hypothetical protein
VDDEDLNRQAGLWAESIANARVHGTTHERPVDRLMLERQSLSPLPSADKVAVWLRQERKVGRDGFVQFERGAYGVPWGYIGKLVQVQVGENTVEIWTGNDRIAVHPRARIAGQRFTLPGQWAGLSSVSARPRKEPLAVQMPSVEVERRPLAEYDALVGVGGSR